MKLTFWGVRGSIPCPGRGHARFGGNTSCVELEIGSSSIIFDAGTGLRSLGASLERRGIKRSHLLLSHTHWDHTCGFPFFRPAYDPSCEVMLIAGHASDRDGGVRRILASQIAPPSFPLSLEQMPATISFRDVPAGTSFDLAGGIRVRTARLVHPDGATGYRVEHNGASVAYVTDTEHDPGRPDASILALIKGADLVIYDSTYTDEEFASHRGWGHSTWEEGVRLCLSAGAKRLAIFHHDPDHDDAFMDRVAHEARQRWSEAFVAREGMKIEITPRRATKRR